MPNFTREIYKSFDHWKDSPQRKPLLLRGARQVGKSYAVRTWGNATFGAENFFEINLEEKPQLKTIFEKDLDPERILNELNFSLGINLRKPNCLFFIDEIQTSPQAISALRYFHEKHPEIHIIAAGSLIEFVLAELSFPVGRIESHFMFPMSFAEFLDASGKNHLREYLDNHNQCSAIDALVHDELLSQLRFYYRIGGMPDAVAAYLKTKDFNAVSNTHATLLQSYQDDFSKYARKTDWDTLISTFKAIPSLVRRGNIKYAHIDAQVRGEKIKKCVNLLEFARLISKVHSSSSAKLPLEASAKQNIFKLIFVDIGLLQQMLGFDWRNILPETELTTIYDGVFAEQFIGQELLANRSNFSLYPLHYWQRNNRGAEAEVDYLIEYKNQPCPLEVKSGKKGGLKSLHKYMEELSPKDAFVLSQQNFSTYESVTRLPLYMAGWIKR